MLDNYAVFGNPVEHSKSPDIHAAFSVATGENISYKKQTVEIDCFAKAADIFFRLEGKASISRYLLSLMRMTMRGD